MPHADDDRHVFTRDEFRATLVAALEAGYDFRTFDRADAVGDERSCLLRHDVDADLADAVVVAQLERELGVRATYFLMLRSPFYNLLGRANFTFAQRLVALDHAIGLHYDEAFRPDDRPMEEWIALEADVLARMLDVDVRTFSFHQPSPKALRSRVSVDGLVNAYDVPGYHYVSDSNMLWREDPPIGLFRSGRHPRLQVLLHPLWWTAEQSGLSPEEVFERALLANWHRTQDQLLATEVAYGPRRTFTITRP